MMKTKNKKQIMNYLGLFLGGFLIGYDIIISELLGVFILVISVGNAATLKEKSRWTGE